MKYLSIFKDLTDIVVSIGVSSIVGNAIKMTTDPAANMPKKIAIGIGGVVLSGLVGDLASKYANEKIDTTVEGIQTIGRKIREAKEEVQSIAEIQEYIDEEKKEV